MTDARAAAIESIEEAVCVFECFSRDVSYAVRNTPIEMAMQAAIAAYLASMAEAGWVMVEDAGEMENNGTWDDYRNGERDGWNACRAAMLGENADA